MWIPIDDGFMKTVLRISLWGLLATACCGSGYAQYVRLNSTANHSALYFDLKHVVNYNIYERWRWGGGLYWVSPDHTAGAQWQVLLYGAFGTYDRRAKYGVTVARSHRGAHQWRPYVAFSDDLAQNSAAYFDNISSIWQGENNTRFVASHFVRQQALLAGVSARWGLAQTLLEARYMRQQALFDNDRLLYPAREEISPVQGHFAEVRLQAVAGGVTAELRGSTASDVPSWHCLRVLLQYDRKVTLGNGGSVDIYTQTGVATSTHAAGTGPLHRQFECFDIGGTYNSHFCFRNSLLTLPPDCFMADRFVRGSLRCQFPGCWWNKPASAPKPFVQTVAALGRHHSTEDRSVVGEAAAGVSGLLRWNMLEMGCAVAWQMLNCSTGETSLRPDSQHARWAFLFCASMLI
ncbi:MAG: hypothetical protein AUK63_762 [bacterium P3]|nr:MAG: hypothetical protein AUK63_762 [bacterium P3]KWW41830.1 MAG: hypothetical protein F083_758 [bacterium F083]